MKGDPATLEPGFTWAGSTCAVGFCDDRALGKVRPLPLCSRHAFEVAQAMRQEVILEHELDQERKAERQQAARGNREGSLVYYVRIGGYIKIGFSTRLRTRMATLRADELLAIEPGGPELERQRHREFAADRIDLRRENFRPSHALLAHIHDTHERYGLPHWATVPRTSEVTTRRRTP